MTLGWMPFTVLLLKVASLNRRFEYIIWLLLVYMAYISYTWLQYIWYRCPNCSVTFFGRQLFRQICPGCGIPINRDSAESIYTRNQASADSRAEKFHINWLGRHWKSVSAIYVVLVISPLIWVLFGMRSSDAVRLSIATAETNPVLTERLGHPLKIGWGISGYVSVGRGYASLGIPVSGPRGSGVLYAVVRRRDGIWRMQSLTLWEKGVEDKPDLLAVPRQNVP